MGYYEAMARRGQKIESEELSKAGRKKSLWGSIGRTAGTLGVMALTGGAVNPVTLGLLTGGASFLGGAIGAKAAGGKLGKKGGWFEKEGQAAQKELGAFGTQNLMSSLKSGLTAGIGQKLELMKSGKTAAKLSDKGFGLDFKGSFVGKGIAKREAAKELSTMRGWQGEYEGLKKVEQLDLMSKGKAPGVFKQTTTGNEFIDRSLGRDRSAYTPTTSGVFDVDLEDVEETVSASDILSNKKTAMSQFFEDPKNVEELGLYTGMGPKGYRSTTWRPEAGTDLREFSDKYKTFSNTEMAGIPEWRSDARDWASEAAGLKSQEFQQSLGITERLGLPGSSKSWQSELFRR